MLEPRLPPPELLPVLMAKVTREQVVRALSRTTTPIMLHHQTASAQGVIRAMVRNGEATIDLSGRVRLAASTPTLIEGDHR